MFLKKRIVAMRWLFSTAGYNQLSSRKNTEQIIAKTYFFKKFTEKRKSP